MQKYGSRGVQPAAADLKRPLVPVHGGRLWRSLVAAARSGRRLLYYRTSPRDRNYHYCEQHCCQQCYFTRWQSVTLWESGKADSVSCYGYDVADDSSLMI